MADLLLQSIGGLIAFLIASAVILIDCDNALGKDLTRVPVNMVKSVPALLLAGAGGVVAAVCFAFSYTDWFQQNGVLELKTHSPILRGVLVGIAVLTILRSKFFNVKENEFGGEFLYNIGRRLALRQLLQNWLDTKNRIASDSCITAAIQRSTFEDELDEVIQESPRLPSPEDKKWASTQFDNVKKDRPAGKPDHEDAKWRLYYRKLIKLALDCGGPKILGSINGFQKQVDKAQRELDKAADL